MITKAATRPNATRLVNDDLVSIAAGNASWWASAGPLSTCGWPTGIAKSPPSEDATACAGCVLWDTGPSTSECAAIASIPTAATAATRNRSRGRLRAATRRTSARVHLRKYPIPPEGTPGVRLCQPGLGSLLKTDFIGDRRRYSRPHLVENDCH